MHLCLVSPHMSLHNIPYNGSDVPKHKILFFIQFISTKLHDGHNDYKCEYFLKQEDTHKVHISNILYWIFDETQ